jgi:hypothetical protein
MSRGAHKISGEPFGTWVAKVRDNRIRLPREITEYVPWLKLEGTQIDCVGRPGAAGGMQLVPLGVHESDVRRLTDAFEPLPEASESGEQWVDLARLLATAWKISICIEANRFSLTLPEPPRRALQLPQSGGTTVVFGFGEILEIWDALKWHEHVRSLAKQKGAVISQATEALGDR